MKKSTTRVTVATLTAFALGAFIGAAQGAWAVDEGAPRDVYRQKKNGDVVDQDSVRLVEQGDQGCLVLERTKNGRDTKLFPAPGFGPESCEVEAATPPPTEPPPTEPPPTNPPPTNPPPTEPPPTTAPPTTAPPTTAPPTTAPPTTPPPSDPDFPDETNTGVPDGMSLSRSGSITVTQDGAVIDGLDVSGVIYVRADDVTIKNTRVRGSGYYLIDTEGSSGTLIQDVELDGKKQGAGSHGVIGSATIERANIHGVENGFTPFSNSVIRDSYIHDLDAPGDAHVDGIQIDGGVTDVRIEGNTILSWDTSAVMVDNYFGPINRIDVVGNYLGNQPGRSTAYTVYSDGQFGGGSIRNVTFRDNVMERGYWGYASVVNNNPTWTNNVDADSGNVIGM